MTVFVFDIRFLIKLIIFMIINLSIRKLSKTFKLLSYKAWSSATFQSSTNIFSIFQTSKFDFSSTEKYSDNLSVKPQIKYYYLGWLSKLDKVLQF